MSRDRRDEEGLPDWLWFFLTLLGVLGAALLYRRRKEMLSEYDYEERPGSWSVGPTTTVPRYVEPDSIPIDVRLEDESPMDEEDDALAAASAAAVEYEPPVTGLRSSGRSPMDEVERISGGVSDAAREAAEEFEPPIVQPSRSSTKAAGSRTRVETSGEDDLTVIEGIGPAISALLKGAGITTYRALADAPEDRLDAILTEAKLRRIADPGTWAEQSRLAAEARWDDLKALQQTLKAGRRTNGE